MPMGQYKDFDECVAKNQDKGNPQAYCGYIKSKVENADKLSGGLGDDKSPLDFDPQQVQMGLKVEAEHTPDPQLQMEIVLDHLSEDPQYYTKLAQVEGSLETDSIGRFNNYSHKV